MAVTHEVTSRPPPLLRTHDRYGHRIDEVGFHPHWHDLTEFAIRHGMHATAWRGERVGACTAKMFVLGQVDAGHVCPISMTYVAVPALRTEPGIASVYEPLLASTTYDFGLREPAGKRGLIAGMSMTEKQGGSDVRANTTALPNADRSYSATGHKWFTSAPMSDFFLTLAVAPGGLICFLLPRVLPEGSRNTLVPQRLAGVVGKAQAGEESPLPSIWEGSGNVSALDSLRAMANSRNRRKRISPRGRRMRGSMRHSMMRFPGCVRILEIWRARNTAPGISSNQWRWSCGVRCYCVPATPRSPTHSAHRAALATGETPSERYPQEWTPRPSSTAQRLRKLR